MARAACRNSLAGLKITNTKKSILEKSHQNHWRHSPGAFTVINQTGCGGGVQGTSNAVMFVSGNPTRQMSFHVLSFSILSVSLLGKVRWKSMDNDSMILKLFTSKIFRHGRKGPNIHNKPKYCHWFFGNSNLCIAGRSGKYRKIIL